MYPAFKCDGRFSYYNDHDGDSDVAGNDDDGYIMQNGDEKENFSYLWKEEEDGEKVFNCNTKTKQNV